MTTATTARMGNPLFSTVENIASVVISVLSVVLPILGIILALTILVLLTVFFIRMRRRRRTLRGI